MNKNVNESFTHVTSSTWLSLAWRSWRPCRYVFNVAIVSNTNAGSTWNNR